MKKIDRYTIFLEKKAEKEKSEKEKSEKEKSEKEKSEKEKSEKEKIEDSEKEEKTEDSEKEEKSKKDKKSTKTKKSENEDESDDDSDEDEDNDEDDSDEDESDDESDKVISKGGVKFEVKKIVSEMFAFGKNIKFSGEQHGDEPEYVDFEISLDDFKLNYVDNLDIEYSTNILKKKQYYVALEFDSKSKEGSDRTPIYKIRFKIKIKPTSLIKFDTTEEEIVGWNFEDKPSKVVTFIKQARVNFDWDRDRSILTMKKSEYNKLNKEQLKILIDKEGGIKILIK